LADRLSGMSGRIDSTPPSTPAPSVPSATPAAGGPDGVAPSVKVSPVVGRSLFIATPRFCGLGSEKKTTTPSITASSSTAATARNWVQWLILSEDASSVASSSSSSSRTALSNCD
jgi:hypothetical protein